MNTDDGWGAGLTRAAAVAACASTLAACATTSGSETVAQAHDPIGIVGPQVPERLEQIKANPYERPQPMTCGEIDRRLAGLDELLGPDFDSTTAADSKRGDGIAGAVGALIPYRGVMRLMTGAGRREKALASAVAAGSARRGYLKGLRQMMACPTAFATPAQAPPPVAADASPKAAVQ